jgi:hypothetical protein
MTKNPETERTPTQKGNANNPANATPSNVPCAKVSAKKDILRHNIKQPSGAVRNTSNAPIVQAGASKLM